jgi:hypothetical protein
VSGVAVYVMVQEQWREPLADHWKAISHFKFRSFRPKKKSDFFRWRTREGTNLMRIPTSTQSWAKLQEEVSATENPVESEFFKEHPYALMAFAMVMPHRVTPALTLQLHRLLVS